MKLDQLEFPEERSVNINLRVLVTQLSKLYQQGKKRLFGFSNLCFMSYFIAAESPLYHMSKLPEEFSA